MTLNDTVFETVGVDDVRDRARGFRSEGYRLVQICGTAIDGGTEVMYSFDRDGDLMNLKMQVPDGTPVESITPEYWAAFVYENEVHDLFGVEFAGSLQDYRGNFFRMSVRTPWKKDGGDE